MAWDEPYCEPERYPTHEEDEMMRQLRIAKEFMEVVVECLYGEGPLDEYKLDCSVEELCHVLDVKLPPGSLTIERKKPNSPFFDYMVSLSKGAAVL